MIVVATLEHTLLLTIETMAEAYGLELLGTLSHPVRAEPLPALRRNRFGLLAFHDRDHGDGGPDSLSWLDALLRKARAQGL